MSSNQVRLIPSTSQQTSQQMFAATVCPTGRCHQGPNHETSMPLKIDYNNTTSRSHKTGCRTWRLGVPSYSTHWMGPNTTPTCDPWMNSLIQASQSSECPTNGGIQDRARGAPVACIHGAWIWTENHPELCDSWMTTALESRFATTNRKRTCTLDSPKATYTRRAHLHGLLERTQYIQ